MKEHSKSIKKKLLAMFVVLLAGAFLGWLWAYLRPDKWHYFTDEKAFSHLAKDVKPRFVVWEDAKPATGEINKPSDKSEPVISPNGTHMILTRGAENGNSDLYLARWDGEKWGDPEPQRALNSKFNEIGPAYSRDGSFLYFSTDRPGGRGGYDIWVSRWDGAEFAWPVPLTLMVNSKYDDFGPEPSYDDGKLYFSSNRPKRPLSETEEKLSDKELREHFKNVDHDLFVAHQIPAGVTNREVERALSMLYSLREAALTEKDVMQKLGGSDESEKAVDRAIKWLADNQETNGCWLINRSTEEVTDKKGKKRKKLGGQQHSVAATSFALLTFFGRSELHNKQCQYNKEVRDGLKWLLDQQNQLTGDMRGRSSGGQGMYDHSIATLALSEGFGISKDPRLGASAQSAVDFLVDAQNAEDGGWRYQPNIPGDMSVSGWAIMALKSAQMSGLHIPRKTFDGIKKWLKNIAGGSEGGIYGYTGKGGGSDAMIATGFFCSQLMGLSPNTPKSFETTDKLGKSPVSVGDVYYAYYGTLSAYQNQGPFWRKWMSNLHQGFLKTQEKDGSWTATGKHGSAMGRSIVTSLITLSLQAHYRYTPLYGLGYEPSRERARFSTANREDLPDNPLYRRAKRLIQLSSRGNDIQPSCTEHGDFLYFASDRKGGSGGYDIYRTRISGEEPEEPRNIGPAVNSKADDTDPTTRMAGFNLAFSSNRDQSNKDLYRMYSSVSRRVLRKHDYSDRPALGWMWKMFPKQLTVLVLALIAFVSLLLYTKKKKKTEDKYTQETKPSFWKANKKWIPSALAFLFMIGMMASVFLSLRHTAWCYYTDDMDIRRDANEADVRLILWDDPSPVVGAFNLVPTNKVTPVFSMDDEKVTIASGSKGTSNYSEFVSSWNGRKWSALEPVNVDTNVVEAVPKRDGSFKYFAEDKEDGLGGLDIYRHRVLDGKEWESQNLGAEINSGKDDSDPSIRMEGFDMMFSSNREMEEYQGSGHLLFASTVREVVGRLDLSRWYALTALFNKMKWWILAALAAIALIIYLLKHWRDLTSLFHKCLAGSVIVHAILLLLMAMWQITMELVESMEPKTMEIALDADALAQEKLALDMQDDITELPPSDVTVLVEKTALAVPMPRFEPRKNQQGPPIITKSSDKSFVTRVTPSKERQENLEVAATKEFEPLPDLEIPKLELELEVPEPIEHAETEEDPVIVDFEPNIVQERVEVEFKDMTKTTTDPVAKMPKSADVSSQTVTNKVAGGARVKDTGGSIVVASAGLEARGALPRMKGAGDAVGLMIKSSGTGRGLRMNAPGKLDVPKGYGQAISPVILKNPGKLSVEVIEGLGGSALTQGSIARALDWFSKNQEADGRWSISKHGGQEGHDVGTTSLILLCYYGWGANHTEPGPYRATVKKALDWLISTMKEGGDLYSACAKNGMYDQGMATIALSEAYGLSKDEKIKKPAQDAVNFVVKAQNVQTGGWRYQPNSSSDTSVFGWQYMALKSGELAGLNVPKETLAKADKWLDSCAGGKHGGLYGYTGKGGNQAAMIATGMFSRQLAKVAPTDPRMREGAVFFREHPLNAKNMDFYYLYYGTLALYQHQGAIWTAWNERMKENLSAMQHKTGSNAGTWDAKGNHGAQMGRAVSTALATLSLEVYYRILPIYGFSKE